MKKIAWMGLLISLIFTLMSPGSSSYFSDVEASRGNTFTAGVWDNPGIEPDTTPPVITLIGDETVNLKVGDTYEDASATATDDVDGDITENIVVVNPVDVNAADTYIITYNVSDVAGNPAIEVTRTVIVSEEPDTTPPTLTEVTPVSTLTNDNTPDYTFNSDEAGTIAYASGCTSATTEAVAGNNTVTFDTLADGIYDSCTIIVTDAAGNPSTALSVSTFTIDTTPPVITLSGDAAVNLTVGDSYTDAGATATDNIDTAVTVVTGGDTVNTAVSGTYTITYNAIDTAGNPATEVTRTVTVSE